MKSQHLIAAAAAIAGGTTAYAEIIHFVNPPEGEPGHYDWHWFIPPHESWLDITRGPGEQSNVRSGRSVGQISHSTSSYSNFTADGAFVAKDVLTAALPFGTPIDGLDFGQNSPHVIEIYKNGEYVPLSNFSTNERLYMGVRTTSGNYGWIAIERDSGSFLDRWSLTAFAWAYETIPGKPIFAGEVPAPGTLALLAFGAVARRTRTRDE